MAAGNSSSRRKPSSSHKKKQAKKSSEVKSRRSSKIKRRNKSKKLHRRDVSVSYSDDDSRTEDSVSISSSASEDDHRRRRARSPTRRDKKRSRKRVRRSSSICEDSRDSPRRQKRKGSKRNDGSEARKKTHQRKQSNGRSQRDASVRYKRRDSRSCSSCRGGSSSSVESEFERSRGRSEGREKSKRSSDKTNNGWDRYKYRSRSCSLCSGSSTRSSYQSEEKLTNENNSRCLRSVLTVVKGSNDAEGVDQCKDENKAEIIQAYDDCPSSRSNDSYDGGRKREPSQHAFVVSEKKRQVDNVKVDEIFTSKITTSQLMQSSKEDAGTQCGQSDLITDAHGLTKMGSKNEVSTGIGGSEGDLELILRQKALENLRKFRGGLHTNTIAPGDQKDVGDIAVKKPSTAKAESTPKGAGDRVAGATQVISQNMENVGMPTIERKSATSSKTDGWIPDVNMSRNEPKAKVVTAHPPLGAGNLPLDQMVAGKATEKMKTNFGAINNKSTHGTSTFKRQTASDLAILKQEPTSQDSPKGKLLETKNFSDKNIAETRKTAPGNNYTLGAEVNKACGSTVPEASSCLNPAAGEHGSNEPVAEIKGGSQFEKKTMSVMRGGEMVKVSYKVYIPKKPPALARRQLHR